jgi:hypothetical protein
VAARGEEVEEALSDVVTCHFSYCSGDAALWGRMASCAPIANRRKLASPFSSAD